MKVDLKMGNCLNFLGDIPQDTVFVSDPPFNIGYHYKTYKDRLLEQEYETLMKQVFANKPAVIVLYPEKLHELSLMFGYAPNKVVSWVYNSNTPKQHRDIGFYNVQCNMKQVLQPYKNPNDRRIKERISRGILGGKLYDWWNVNQVKNVSKPKGFHPCQMPLKVMENIVGVLDYNATICDPFMGTGTTGEAVLNMNEQQGANRNFIGIELDSEYFNYARERMRMAQNKMLVEE